jgi:hypothetical protein
MKAHPTDAAAGVLPVSHRQCEVVEHFRAVPPTICIAIFALTLVVKAVHLQRQQQQQQQYHSTAV